MITKSVTWAGTGIIAAAGLLTGVWAVDDRYAKQDVEAQIHNEVREEIDLVSQRLNVYILQDKADYIQRRIWKLEDRYGPGVRRGTQSVKEEYRRLKMELEKLRRQMRQRR